MERIIFILVTGGGGGLPAFIDGSRVEYVHGKLEIGDQFLLGNVVGVHSIQQSLKPARTA